MTGTPIEFWFDLSSPYSYFAGQEIDALALRHGRVVHWKPFLLGVIFKTTGSSPLTRQPLKGDYARLDWARAARLANIPFVLRDDFPKWTHVPARMVMAAEAEVGMKAAGAFAKSLLRTLFAQGADITDPHVAATLGTPLGLDADWLIAAADEARWHDELDRRCDEAVARGICGSPWTIVDGEPFWGSDRLVLADHWLSTGGW